MQFFVWSDQMHHILYIMVKCNKKAQNHNWGEMRVITQKMHISKQDMVPNLIMVGMQVQMVMMVFEVVPLE